MVLEEILFLYTHFFAKGDLKLDVRDFLHDLLKNVYKITNTDKRYKIVHIQN